MLFVGIMEMIVYPALRKIGRSPTPLQRIAAGGLFTAASFVCAGVLQLRVDAGNVSMPHMGRTHVHVLNTLPCTVHVRAQSIVRQVQQGDVTTLDNIHHGMHALPDIFRYCLQALCTRIRRTRRVCRSVCARG